MSFKSQSNLRTNSLQYLENEPLNVLKLIVDRILWIEMIEISFFNIFWQTYIEKDFYNCIAIPWKWVAPSMSLKPHSNTWFFFFRWVQKWIVPFMSLKLQPIFHLGSPRKTDPTKCQVSFGKLRKKLFLGGLGGVRFPGPSKVANCQSVEDCKKYVIFRDIDGATPTHSPKSGCKCPHRWRNSLISPDIHQPT